MILHILWTGADGKPRKEGNLRKHSGKQKKTTFKNKTAGINDYINLLTVSLSNYYRSIDQLVCPSINLSMSVCLLFPFHILVKQNTCVWSSCTCLHIFPLTPYFLIYCRLFIITSKVSYIISISLFFFVRFEFWLRL